MGADVDWDAGPGKLAHDAEHDQDPGADHQDAAAVALQLVDRASAGSAKATFAHARSGRGSALWAKLAKHRHLGPAFGALHLLRLPVPATCRCVP